jgi:hypothetical protein
MYIFSRRRLIHPGRFRQALGDGVAVATTVTELTDVPVMVWMSQYDPDGAAMVWSARFETMTEIDGAFAELMGSDGYQDQVEALDGLFEGQPVDSLIEIVAGGLGDAPAPLVSVVQAVAANGRQQEAIAWGVDIAEKAASALSLPVAFGVGAYGRYGSMGWITSYEDVATIDDARGKLMADAVLQDAIDDGSGNVQPDATNILLRRLN